MTTTSQEALRAGPLTRYRYWILADDEARLDPISYKDKTVWSRGITRAACRHNPRHTPPEPACTCGLFAVGPVDIQYMVALRRWRHRMLGRVKYGFIAGAMVTPAPPATVIGQVKVVDAVKFDYPIYKTPHPDGGQWPTMPAVRAGSARITRLWVPQKQAGVADELADRYGAPCEVGAPPYTRAQWNARTPMGLRPPFALPEFRGTGVLPR